jgi:hypothetical protein
MVCALVAQKSWRSDTSNYPQLMPLFHKLCRLTDVTAFALQNRESCPKHLNWAGHSAFEGNSESMHLPTVLCGSLSSTHGSAHNGPLCGPLSSAHGSAHNDPSDPFISSSFDKTWFQSRKNVPASQLSTPLGITPGAPSVDPFSDSKNSPSSSPNFKCTTHHRPESAVSKMPATPESRTDLQPKHSASSPDLASVVAAQHRLSVHSCWVRSNQGSIQPANDSAIHSGVRSEGTQCCESSQSSTVLESALAPRNRSVCSPAQDTPTRTDPLRRAHSVCVASVGPRIGQGCSSSCSSISTSYSCPVFSTSSTSAEHICRDLKRNDTCCRQIVDGSSPFGSDADKRGGSGAQMVLGDSFGQEAAAIVMSTSEAKVILPGLSNLHVALIQPLQTTSGSCSGVSVDVASWRQSAGTKLSFFGAETRRGSHGAPAELEFHPLEVHHFVVSRPRGRAAECVSCTELRERILESLLHPRHT